MPIALQSTMQDRPLTITSILEHGCRVHAGSEVVTLIEPALATRGTSGIEPALACQESALAERGTSGRGTSGLGDGVRRASFARVADRAERLAAALRRLGVREGDRVATFCWNTQEHLEAYFAIPCMGAVLHTLNIRLFPEQLVYIANHAEDRVILVEDSLVPLLARVVAKLDPVRHIVVIGDGDASPLGRPVLRYEDLLAAERPGAPWPDLDERAAAAMCYTSGTTGHPKGVVYSHRSTWLHSIATCTGAVFALTPADRILPIVPMFHANAWGLPYAGWMAGSDFVMPGRFLQAEPMCRLIAQEKPTMSAAVPTIWNDILRYAELNPVDLSSLRLVACGGSAVPRGLIEKFQARHGVRIVQAWGMTETSPLGAIAHPPKGTPPEAEMEWRARTGRVVAGVEMRIVDGEDSPLAWDGKSVGEIQVRGPWITGAYYLDPAPEKFQDGWLRTGDVGTIDAKGFVQITDRAKDVIKSGGEWISSVELENAIMGHPDVVEAAVVGVPDPRWDERPLACVVLREGAKPDPESIRAFLGSRVARWWIPERWSFIGEVPKTSVGKFDKKVLRARFAAGELTVQGGPDDAPQRGRGRP